MKPSECKDMYTAMNELNEQGIGFGDYGITINPGYVILEIHTTTIKVPMRAFERMATWYLEDQIKE